MSDCLFCKIVKGEVPSKKVYEDDDMLAFHDIKPHAPVHLLIIPKVHIEKLADATKDHTELLGKMLLKAPELAEQAGCTNGFRTVINNGHVGGQEVYHLHVHVLGGQTPLGPILSR